MQQPSYLLHCNIDLLLQTHILEKFFKQIKYNLILQQTFGCNVEALRLFEHYIQTCQLKKDGKPSSSQN